VDITTVSVRRSAEVLSAATARGARTRWLVPAPPWVLVRAHARAARRPAACSARWRAGSATRLAAAGKQVMYWGEAVLLWDLLRRERLEHVHVHFANNASDIALLAARLGRATGQGVRSFSLHLHGPTDFYDVSAPDRAQGARGRGHRLHQRLRRSQALAHMPLEAAGRVHVARYGAPAPVGGPSGRPARRCGSSTSRGSRRSRATRSCSRRCGSWRSPAWRPRSTWSATARCATTAGAGERLGVAAA